MVLGAKQWLQQMSYSCRLCSSQTQAAHQPYTLASAPHTCSCAGPRPMHGANMLLEAKQWLQQAYPHWNRTGGKDHVWLVTHDEGSCWVPSELRSSIILSHWGRKVNETPGQSFMKHGNAGTLTSS